MNPKKLSTIAKWPEPCKVHHLQSFLGFTNFYCCFIDGYSRIVHLLVALTQKNAEWSWNDDARTAFQSLKDAFTKAPVLTHFNPLSPSTLATDTSDFAILGVLQQPDEQGHLHPVAYYSRKLTPSEINYDIHDKELLAVVECFCGMRAWLLGSTSPISVVCDHCNLEYFMHSQVLNCCQACWAMFLSEFDFHLDWAAGSSNVADASSHCSDYFSEQGDEWLEVQHCVLLTPLHTEHLFPSTAPITPPASNMASALVTLTLDNSDMLQQFLTAFQEDLKWRRSLANGNSNFTVQNDLVFHNGHLVVASHLGHTHTLNLVFCDYSWPAYHAQTDSLTEHTNQTLEIYLCSYVSYQQNDWVDYLPLAEFAFNNSKNALTKQSPFFANLSYHPIFEPIITKCSTTPAADDLAKRLQQIHTELCAELQHAQETQAHYYNQ
uniref:Reverse transcriptase/retrotransposon-derived protein RNase H-like domain-containing protein n=1 Tax=Moniliophthora roreri TaxID=221103 RepID=A0A0W0EY66_MONRR